MGKIWNYLKCAYENKAVLAGYLTTSSSIVTFYMGVLNREQNLVSLSAPLAFAGMFLLGVTEFGEYTLRTYNRTKKHIKKFNTLDRRFQELNGEDYCNKSGVRLAAKEAGLEDLLIY